MGGSTWECGVTRAGGWDCYDDSVILYSNADASGVITRGHFGSSLSDHASF